MGSQEERKPAIKSKSLEPLMGTPVREPFGKHARMDSPFPDTAVSETPAEISSGAPPGLPAGSADGNGDGAGIGDGIVGGPGTKKNPATSVEDMFQQMLSKMSTVTETVSGVKEEVAQIRENMVPRSEFTAHMEDMKAFKHEVDTKFANLSVSGSSGDGGAASLKQAVAKQARALDRLDVAHKSVCMDGFALDMSASARMAEIEKFVQQHFAGIPIIKTESIFAGARGSRSISKKTVVEFQSQVSRDRVLSDMQTKQLQFNCAGQPISVKRQNLKNNLIATQFCFKHSTRSNLMTQQKTKYARSNGRLRVTGIEKFMLVIRTNQHLCNREVT